MGNNRRNPYVYQVVCSVCGHSGGTLVSTGEGYRHKDRAVCERYLAADRQKITQSKERTP